MGFVNLRAYCWVSMRYLPASSAVGRHESEESSKTPSVSQMLNLIILRTFLIKIISHLQGFKAQARNLLPTLNGRTFDAEIQISQVQQHQSALTDVLRQYLFDHRL